MLSLRESLRVFLAGVAGPCREVGSGTDKFNDDQRFTTGEHDLRTEGAGEFHGKDNTANLSQGSEMRMPDICRRRGGVTFSRLNAKSAYLTFLGVFLRYFWV